MDENVGESVTKESEFDQNSLNTMGKGQQLKRQTQALPVTSTRVVIEERKIGNTSSLLQTGNVPPSIVPVTQAEKTVVISSSMFQGTDGVSNLSNFILANNDEKIAVISQLLSETKAPSSGNNSMKVSHSTQSIKSLSEFAVSNSKHCKSSSSLTEMTLASSSSSSSLVDIISIVKRCGLASFEGNTIVGMVLEYINSNSSVQYEKGLYVLKSMLELFGRNLEPVALHLLPKILNFHTDRSNIARDLSSDIVSICGDVFSPFSIYIMYESSLAVALSEGSDWRIKVAALQLLKIFAPRVTGMISPILPDLIPLVSGCICDPKKAVQGIAIEALTAACSAISNEDVLPLVPRLISVIAKPEESPATMDLLLETTFVTAIDSPTLALITPLLAKSLRGRQSAMKRKAARVVENMCRLVVHPAEVAPFVPLLLPALDKVVDEVTDLEVCQVAASARDTLLRAVGAGDSADAMRRAASVPGCGTPVLCYNGRSKTLPIAQVQEQLFGDLSKAMESVVHTAPPQSPAKQMHLNLDMLAMTTDYIAKITAHMIAYNATTFSRPILEAIESAGSSQSSIDLWRFVASRISFDDWKENCEPYLTVLFGTDMTANSCNGGSEVSTKETEDGFQSLQIDEDSPAMDQSAGPRSLSAVSEEVLYAFRAAVLRDISDSSGDSDETAANLCNIHFSLAFGGKTLLHQASLRLGKGRRYGVMGKNGSGKTTLLTNIASGNIEGLPVELRTVYVMHENTVDDGGVGILPELLADPLISGSGVTEGEARSALQAVRFTESMLLSPRSSLSGGWKMKLLIIRAMLLRPDILLLDEPTNHLDAASVEWLMAYLVTHTDLTCMIVSHDTAFLDAVVTDIIHYEAKQLVYYHGSLSHFVALHPEAKHYYELASSTMTFTFPVPGRLDGINSVTRTILKIENVTYTYPGSTQPSITDASVKLCLGSRVAVIGPNGAGKSTLIKLLVQEIEPDMLADGVTPCGDVWKHHNLIVAYVAQHSFHHVEQHLDKSPVDYIKWRFDKGVDKESLSKSVLQISTEELDDIKREQRYGDVEKIVGRRKNARTIEYECTFVGQTSKEPNKYIPLEEMIERGMQKQVQQADIRISAIAAGLDTRPLINREIQAHLDHFNLEAEYGTHSNICRLSGGQKVKLVLAAAMWNQPHVIVLDEPTNYLDREALGALTQAIKSFGGAIVIISHHQEFTDELCSERWLVNEGVCVVEGELQDDGAAAGGAKPSAAKKQKSNSSSMESADDSASAGNTNATKAKFEQLKNPKTLEPLTKVEIRKLTRCAAVAGVSLKEYVSKINKTSPEWAWLSSTIR